MIELGGLPGGEADDRALPRRRMADCAMHDGDSVGFAAISRPRRRSPTSCSRSAC
ncbi:hypothetical protein ACWDKQ_13115 [Saccharopolyspora sp. NPDC000995]